MTERPILFSAPMVCALLADTKTQTRRIVKPQPTGVLGKLPPDSKRAGNWWFSGGPPPFASFERRCPYGVPGDVLWVRETLRRSEVGPWVYRADHEPVEMRHGDPRISEMVAWAHHKEGDTCVSIHMPRWASRLSLRVTDVRVERLNDISEADALAEGVSGSGHRDVWPPCAKAAYQELWDAINGVGAWSDNPWVWAVSFERTGLDKP